MKDKYIWFGRIGLAALLFVALIHFTDVKTILKTLRSANPAYYSLAALLFLSTYIPSGLRWRELTNNSTSGITVIEGIKIMAIAYGLNKAVPGNAGDLSRSKLTDFYTEIESHAEVLGVTVLERVMDFCIVTLIIGLSLLLAGSGQHPQLIWILVSGGLISLTAIIIAFKRTPSFPVLTSRFEKIIKISDNFAKGYRSTGRKSTLKAIGYTFLKWSIEGLVFYILALSIDAGIGLWTAVLTTSVISIIAAFPITPAGLGFGDTAAVAILTSSGLGGSLAVSLVLLQRSIGVLLMGLIGTATYSYESLYRAKI